MPTLFVTAPPDAAATIAETLVEEELAACVNRLDCRSTYRWEGEVVTDDEAVLLVKTTERAVGTATDRIEALHPYDVPCVERFEATDVLDRYTDWIEAVVAGG